MQVTFGQWSITRESHPSGKMKMTKRKVVLFYPFKERSGEREFCLNDTIWGIYWTR